MRTKTLLFSVGISLAFGLMRLTASGESIATIDADASTFGVLQASDVSSSRSPEHAVAPSPRPRRTLRKFVMRKSRAVAKALPARTANVVPKVSAAPALHPAIDKPDIELRDQLLFDEAISVLPARCRNTLKNFYVRYEKQEHRGLAGADVMILDGTLAMAEKRSLFFHEFMHVMDLNTDVACLGGTRESGESEFRDGDAPVYRDDPSVEYYRISWITSSAQRSGSQEEDFCSLYGASNAFEDIAECLPYFILHNETFRKRAESNPALAAKYRWIEENFFPNGISVATTLAPWTGTIPWDVTKQPYKWKPEFARGN